MMSRKSLSSAVEDYLKAIYEIQLEEGRGRVTTSALAEKLSVTRASVTGMLKKLAGWDPKLVRYERYRGVELTSAGEKIALEVVRHHRLIECYLMEALGYSWDEVDAEADRLEHVISEEFEERIAALLGNPRLDPHGAPIPGRDGSIEGREEMPLSELPPGQAAYVSRVSDHDPALLRYLSELGFELHAEVMVIDRAPFDGPLSVRLGNTSTTLALGLPVANAVFVTAQPLA
jgi:DtxR family Mn-dependent transcriptional regulator